MFALWCHSAKALYKANKLQQKTLNVIHNAWISYVSASYRLKSEIETVNKYCVSALQTSTWERFASTRFRSSCLSSVTAWLWKHVQLQAVVSDIFLTSHLELSRKTATLVQKSIETTTAEANMLSMNLICDKTLIYVKYPKYLAFT